MNKRFGLLISSRAWQDIHSLETYLDDECASPLTARRYVEGLLEHISWLKIHASVFPISYELCFRYGKEIRRVNYGKMAILYSIEGDVVIVHRIIAQSLIY